MINFELTTERKAIDVTDGANNFYVMTSSEEEISVSIEVPPADDGSIEQGQSSYFICEIPWTRQAVVVRERRITQVRCGI
ncbi:hypothetical protein OSTOST_10216, partial [Ostertagia ostertagi]